MIVKELTKRIKLVSEALIHFLICVVAVFIFSLDVTDS